MSPERPEDDDFLEDEEQEEYGQRSIFATGWFRAVLVLLVLAVIAVIAVPLIGGWFEPTPPPPKLSSSPPATAPPPAPAPSAPKTETPPPAATPTVPSTPPAAQAPTSTPPPAVSAPAPPASTPPSPSSSTASGPTGERSAEKAPPTKAPERTASAPSKSAARSAGSGNYWVQVGAFKESRNAEGLARTLRAQGFPVQVATVIRDTPIHVVRVGGYPDRSKAGAARQELQGRGHSGFVTQGPAK
ncbi:MAG TPA: SPOR domain-containing protein [Methylomirabilota bacterium]|nr:SPOR domain-containing protein [Methylomirabilota bacterium]